MWSASYPVTGQTLDQTEDRAIKDVRDHTAIVRLFFLPGTEQQLSWKTHEVREGWLQRTKAESISKSATLTNIFVTVYTQTENDFQILFISYTYLLMPATNYFILHLSSFLIFLKATLHTMLWHAKFSANISNLGGAKVLLYAYQTVLSLTF